jgi:hypothetical protein
VSIKRGVDIVLGHFVPPRLTDSTLQPCCLA